MTGKRQAAAHDAQGARVVLAGGERKAVAQQDLALDPVDDGPPARWREGEPHRRLGEPVHGRHGLALEAVGGKARAEAREGVRADGLGAVEGHAPGTQFEPFEGLIR
ncbi:hypothetical protein D3C86_1543900 [compost metagenome]